MTATFKPGDRVRRTDDRDQFVRIVVGPHPTRPGIVVFAIANNDNSDVYMARAEVLELVPDVRQATIDRFAEWYRYAGTVLPRHLADAAYDSGLLKDVEP